MRPDVAQAFDRMARRSRRRCIALGSTAASARRRAGRLFARNPDPKWVAPPGKSLHRLATELDLGPRSAYPWLAPTPGEFYFVKVRCEAMALRLI